MGEYGLVAGAVRCVNECSISCFRWSRRIVWVEGMWYRQAGVCGEDIWGCGRE